MSMPALWCSEVMFTIHLRNYDIIGSYVQSPRYLGEVFYLDDLLVLWKRQNLSERAYNLLTQAVANPTMFEFEFEYFGKSLQFFHKKVPIDFGFR